MDVRTLLVFGLLVVTVIFLVVWVPPLWRGRETIFARPKAFFTGCGIGLVTDFFDTLGIGSFAPTTSLFKLTHLVPDEQIPGTLNVGHLLPTIVEALIFIAIVHVDPLTLVALIVASVLGAWFGAGVVARWPRRFVQIGMGGALLVAAALFVMKNLAHDPGGAALGLHGMLLVLAIVMNFCFGALMTIGIGLYAPAMIMVGLLGMNPKAAFPIMMGSCAFLMPAAGIRFIRFDAYSLRTSLALALGGIPGVLIAAYIVKELPIYWVRWLVVGVVVYAAASMLRSAYNERANQRTASAEA